MLLVVSRGAGAFKVAVGNTLMTEPTEVKVKPEDVKPLVSPRPAKPAVVLSHKLQRRPELVKAVKVPYPPRARQMGVEGKVLLRLRIDERGRVIDVKVIKGVGFGLDEAAVAAARQFVFKPAIAGGKPVATSIVFTYIFRLED